MLQYDILVKMALSELPEFATKYNKMLNDGIFDNETGNHIVFSWTFVPLLKDAIKNNKTDLRDRMLGFLEKMAASDDHLVQEVCDFTVLEELCDEIPTKYLYPLLGKHAREGYNAITKYLIPISSKTN